MGGTRLTEHLWFIYGPLEGRTVYFTDLKTGLTASLEHRLEGSPEGTLGGISYIFLLCFTVLLKQLRRLYTSGSIFKCR
jgi:hypothetical protein